MSWDKVGVSLTLIIVLLGTALGLLIYAVAAPAHARDILVRFTQEGEVASYEIQAGDELFEIEAPTPNSEGIHQVVLDVPTFKHVSVTARSVSGSGLLSEISNEITYPSEVCGATIADVVAIRRHLAGIGDQGCGATQ